MKKKDKQQKPKEMPEFEFKDFSAEEGRIYEEAVITYREAVSAGKTLKQAYESYAISDSGLRALIQADFLKIMIAERHFALGQSLEEVAESLDVGIELIRDTHARMLQEVGVTAATQFGQEYGPLTPKTSD